MNIAMGRDRPTKSSTVRFMCRRAVRPEATPSAASSGAEFQRDQRRVAGPRADRSSKQGSSMLAEPHIEKGAVERPLPRQLACLFDPADGPNRFQAAFAQEVTDDFGEKELS